MKCYFVWSFTQIKKKHVKNTVKRRNYIVVQIKTDRIISDSEIILLYLHLFVFIIGFTP